MRDERGEHIAILNRTPIRDIKGHYLHLCNDVKGDLFGRGRVLRVELDFFELYVVV